MEKVPVREVWPNEAQNFTPWLAKNLELLGEALGLDLNLVGTEMWSGGPWLDILATDGIGAKVAIENQLEVADHRHLGQILTYAAWHDASTLIWITDSFKDEHRTTLNWLNRWTRKKIEVYGVEVRVIAIGKSIRVPKFVPVVSPTAQSKEAIIELPARVTDSVSDKQGVFQTLVDEMQDRGFTDTRKVRVWIQQFDSKLVPGLTYNAGIENDPRVFMDMNDKRMKTRVFNALRRNKRRTKQMEKELGIERVKDAKMIWGKGNRNINVARKKPENHPIYSDDEFEEIWDWIFDYLVKFEQVFDGRVREIMEKRGWLE